MKLTVDLAEDVKRMYRKGYFTQSALADMFGVCQMTISKVVRGVVYAEARPSERERFDSYIDRTPGQGPNGDCYGWKSTIADGYAKFKRTQSTDNLNASRMAWILANGPIPDELEICHHCDNRSCCKLEHLFIGTHLENMQDANRKGRLGKKRVN